MIVPPFRLSQTCETVSLMITAKYLRLQDMEFLVEDDKIFFYCKPYHLKLCLPGSLENELVSSKYDTDNGLITFDMKKKIPGEHFPNLDLIIRLLSPVNEKKKVDRVLVLDDQENVSWEETVESAYKYGFAMKGLYDFHRVIDEFEVLKVDPRKKNLEERYKLQMIDEQLRFSTAHYEADFAEEGDVIRDLLILQSPWYLVLKHEIAFDEAEIDILKDLPNKNYNLSKEQRMFCYTSLIDIIFAYCYDQRSTSFETNSESGWTIAEVAASLGWLAGFSDVKSAVICAFRRSLIFPLYRNFNFSKQVFEDVKKIFLLGEVCITKCLLHIYKIFLGGDCCRYILNEIFIKDYIIYVSKWDTEEWNTIVQEVIGLKIRKEELKLGLVFIERQFLRRVLHRDSLDSDDEADDNNETEPLTQETIEMFSKKLRDTEDKLKTDQAVHAAASYRNLCVDVSGGELMDICDVPSSTSQNVSEEEIIVCGIAPSTSTSGYKKKKPSILALQAHQHLQTVSMLVVLESLILLMTALLHLLLVSLLVI